MSSILKVDTIQTAAGGTPTAADLGLNVSGSVLQVKQGSYGDSAIINTTTYTGFGLSVSITPTSTSSKILITYNVHAQASGGNEYAHLRIYRDGTSVYVGNARGNRTPATSAIGASNSASTIYMQSNTYLDSPNTTSAVVYEIRCRSYDGGGTNRAYINRSENDDNISQVALPVSTITVMEIAG